MIHFIAAALLTASLSSIPQESRDVTRLLVPAYFYPAGDGLKEWDRLLRSKGLDRVIVILNPASGPGTARDPNYVRLLERLGKTKMTPIGYLTTSYAKRPLADVKAEIDGWLRLYPGVRGVFLDEQASGREHLDYYEELYRYAKREKRLSLVVSNAGTICDEGYFSRPCADTICLFEGTLKPDALKLPAWTSKYPAAAKSALVYGLTDSDEMRRLFGEARRLAIATLYITDATGVNPWNRLPSYWSEELAATPISGPLHRAPYRDFPE